eukprot:378504-Rhodomonas_salina.1
MVLFWSDSDGCSGAVTHLRVVLVLSRAAARWVGKRFQALCTRTVMKPEAVDRMVFAGPRPHAPCDLRPQTTRCSPCLTYNVRVLYDNVLVFHDNVLGCTIACWCCTMACWRCTLTCGARRFERQEVCVSNLTHVAYNDVYGQDEATRRWWCACDYAGPISLVLSLRVPDANPLWEPMWWCAGLVLKSVYSGLPPSAMGVTRGSAFHIRSFRVCTVLCPPYAVSGTDVGHAMTPLHHVQDSRVWSHSMTLPGVDTGNCLLSEEGGGMTAPENTVDMDRDNVVGVLRNSGSTLRTPYAMSGTAGISLVLISLHARNAMSGTDMAPVSISLRARNAMPGIEIACGQTVSYAMGARRLSATIAYGPLSPYAMPGTDIAYDAI